MGRFDMRSIRPLRERELQCKEIFLSGSLPGNPHGSVPEQTRYRTASKQYLAGTPLTELPVDQTEVVQYKIIMEMNAFPVTQCLHLYQHGRYVPLSPHRHDYYEMVCMIDGTCQHSIGDDCSSLSRGDIALIPPGTVHNIIAFNDDSIVYNLGFPARTLDHFTTFIPDARHPLCQLFEQTRDGRAAGSYLVFHTGDHLLNDTLLADLDAEQSLDAPYRDEQLSLLLYSFLLQLMRRFSNDTLYFAGHDASREERLLLYIRNHFRTVHLSELCEQFHYGERQIQRLIKKAAGCTFSEYVTQLRIEYFAEQLQSTRSSIAQLAQWTGIENLTFLYRKFKERYGVTPAEYRSNRIK